jgi:uncharacterized protein (TIGR02996 family)
MNDNQEGQALLAKIQENLADLAPRLIYSDWLEEQGRLQEALFWRGQKPTELDLYNLYSHGNGNGNGYNRVCDYNYVNGCGCGDSYYSGYSGYIQEKNNWLEKHKFMRETSY